MTFSTKSFVFIFLLLVAVSCNKKFLVSNQYIIKRQKGLMVFNDNASRKYRNIGKGDVFIDSLIPDFFIPYNSFKKEITKEDIDKVLFSKREHKVSFFYLIPDCNGESRRSAMETDCTLLFLDKNIDEYLHSNKIYVQPAEIEFTKLNIDREYYQLHTSIMISYKGMPLKLIFNKGSYQVLRTNVLGL